MEVLVSTYVYVYTYIHVYTYIGAVAVTPPEDSERRAGS